MKLRYPQRLILPIVLLLTTWGLFVSHLDRTIQYDEAFTYLYYSQSPIVALFAYTLPNNHLFHSFLVWISTSFVGDSLIAIRLPALVAGTLTIAVIYRIGYQFFSDKVGLLSGTILIALPFFGEYFVNARGYTLSSLLTLIFLWIIFRAFYQRTPSTASGRALFAVSILLVMTLPTMVLLIAPVVLTVLFFTSRKTWTVYLAPIMIGTAVGTLLYLPAIVFGWASEFPDRFGFDNPTELWVGFMSELGNLWVLIPLLIGCVLAIVLHALSHKKYIIASVILIFGVAVAASFLQYWLTGGVLFPRNYIYLVPIVVLLSAIGWMTLAHRYAVHTFIVYGVILCVGVFSIFQYQFLNSETDIDELNQALQSYSNSTDHFVVGCCLDAPIYYIYQENYQNDRERVILIPSAYDDETTLRENYEIQDLVCEPDIWNNFEVLICPPE